MDAKAGFLVVVGDEYAEFAVNSHVVTASELQRRLCNDGGWTGEEVIVIGQGIGVEQRDRLRASAAALRLEHCLVDADAAAPMGLTHKRSEKNVLISSPRQVAPSTYAFAVSIDDAVDRLSDHVTGQHLGAMLLTEAARQAVIAVLEMEYARGSGLRFGFLLHKLQAEFDSYVFPLPVAMTATVADQAGRTRPNQHAALVTIQITQGGATVCRLVFDVSLYEESLLQKIETRGARRAIDLLRSQHEPSAKPAERIA